MAVVKLLMVVVLEKVAIVVVGRVVSRAPEPWVAVLDEVFDEVALVVWTQLVVSAEGVLEFIPSIAAVRIIVANG